MQVIPADGDDMVLRGTLAVTARTQRGEEGPRRQPDGGNDESAGIGYSVYAIDGRYDRDGAIPPEAVLGAWKVDDAGNMTGEFIPNPNYLPGHPKRDGWTYSDGPLPG